MVAWIALHFTSLSAWLATPLGAFVLGFVKEAASDYFKTRESRRADVDSGVAAQVARERAAGETAEARAGAIADDLEKMSSDDLRRDASKWVR